MPAFRTILFAADFSERSRAAFRVACSLAEETKTRLFVLHVLEQMYIAEEPLAFGELGMPLPPTASDPAHLRELRERLREAYAPPDRPITVECLVREGVATEEILRAAGELGADLIALGTHGRTGLKRLMAGSVAEAVLRRAPCPVLALHAPDDLPARVGPIRTILHPTDFSDAARSALRVARALARDHGARLLLLYVAPIELLQGTVPLVPEDPRAYQDALMAMRAETEGPDLKYPVEIQCERGDAAAGILRVAEAIAGDLIVLGTHGRTGLARLLMGSVAEAVLRRAPCPVLVVRPSQVTPAGAEAPAEAARSGSVTVI